MTYRIKDYSEIDRVPLDALLYPWDTIVFDTITFRQLMYILENVNTPSTLAFRNVTDVELLDSSSFEFNYLTFNRIVYLDEQAFVHYKKLLSMKPLHLYREIGSFYRPSGLFIPRRKSEHRFKDDKLCDEVVHPSWGDVYDPNAKISAEYDHKVNEIFKNVKCSFVFEKERVFTKPVVERKEIGCCHLVFFVAIFFSVMALRTAFL